MEEELPCACRYGLRKVPLSLHLFDAACRHRHTSAAIATDARIDPEWQPVVEERLLGLGKIHGIEDFLSGWFHGAPFESLK